MNQNEVVEVKIKALQIARDMKPTPVYTNFGNTPTVQLYDVLKEAESIYQWIIK